MQVYKKLHSRCIASEQTILQKLDLHEAPPKQEFHMSNFTLEGGKIIIRDNSVGRHPELIHEVQSDVWLYKAGTSTTWTLSFLWVKSLKWNLFHSISSSIFTKGNKLFFSSFLSLLFPTVKRLIKYKWPLFWEVRPSNAFFQSLWLMVMNCLPGTILNLGVKATLS